MFRRLFALLMCIVLSPPLWSATNSEVVLQIAILRADGGTERSLSLTTEDLQALGHAHFSTSTPWTEGVHSFEGVSLRDLLASLKISSGTMYMFAVNEYMVEVPFSDAVADGPIIAYAADGKPMPLRDKGPLWLVYPYDSKPDFNSETIYARSIWQLNRIEITP